MEIIDWTLAGGGMEGESYFSETHPDLMMKVYTASTMPPSIAGDEFRQVKKLERLGVSVPEALEVTSFRGHPALISRRILHGKSFCRMAGESPGLIPELAGRMASMARELHSKPVSGDNVFPGALEKYRRLLESNEVLEAEAKSRVSKALDTIQTDDTPTLLHGDMHFGNIITDGAADYFIDLGDVSCGNPKHDLAMFYITTHYGSDHSFNFLYHLTRTRALDFWEAFKTGYFQRKISDGEVFRSLRNYMLSRCVWFKIPQIQTSLCSILCREDPPLTAEIKLRELGE